MTDKCECAACGNEFPREEMVNLLDGSRGMSINSWWCGDCAFKLVLKVTEWLRCKASRGVVVVELKKVPHDDHFSNRWREVLDVHGTEGICKGSVLTELDANGLHNRDGDFDYNSGLVLTYIYDVARRPELWKAEREVAEAKKLLESLDRKCQELKI